MLPGMSVHPSLAGSIMADSWPMANVMAGMSAVPVGHAIDLAFFFPVEDRARHDALIAETRRHLGGCLTAIETALRLALADEPAIGAVLARWPQGVCWPTICAQPTLLGPALLAHMQMRAGVSLLLRQVGRSDGEQVDQPDVDLILSPDASDAEAPDTLLGGDGDDTIHAGANDLVDGGDGDDTYVLRSDAGGAAVITYSADDTITITLADDYTGEGDYTLTQDGDDVQVLLDGSAVAVLRDTLVNAVGTINVVDGTAT